jgi:trans-aconitate methyltransferase
MCKTSQIARVYNNAADWYDENHLEYMERKRPYLDLVSAHLPASPDATILDLGCGTGRPIAQFFIEKGYRITGIDVSTNMITKCQIRFPHQEWIVADMARLSLGKTFAAVIMWDSLFHLTPDGQRTMFAVLGKHSASNALLVFNTGTQNGESRSNWAAQDFWFCRAKAVM